MAVIEVPGQARTPGLTLPDSLWATLHRVATGESWPPASREAVERLLAAAMGEGLLPLLFDQEGGPPVVRETLARLRLRERLRRHRVELMLAVAGQALRLLGDEPYIVLKGADYAYRLYASPTLRPMEDIDVLVPRERIDATVARLRQAGLVEVNTGTVTKLPAYYARTLRLGGMTIDVHHSFIQRPRARIDYAAVWARRVPASGVWAGASRLADADALVYHALGLAKDEFLVPLLRYVDFWLMARGDAGLLAEAAVRAREWRVKRALFGALTRTAQVFADLDRGAGPAVAASLLIQPARAFLNRWVLPDAWEHARRVPLSRGRQLWRKFWLMDGLARRLAFGAYHVSALARAGALSTRAEGERMDA